MAETDNSAPLRQQLAYDRARAAEYDQWWLRQGRYDRGAAFNAQWFADATEVASALSSFSPAGRLLELGWQFDIRQTDHYFLYGAGQRLKA